jgi:hypothetical protein
MGRAADAVVGDRSLTGEALGEVGRRLHQRSRARTMRAWTEHQPDPFDVREPRQPEAGPPGGARETPEYRG